MTQLDTMGGAPPDNADIAYFAYPASAMLGDYLRAGAGLIPSAAILATIPVDSVAGVVIGGFAAIFGAFAIRTALRHGTRIEVTETGVRALGLKRTEIDWAALDRMKLAYYSTRRDRKSGWMQLQLGAGRARLSLDSRLDGFDRLVRFATAAAAERELELSEPTAANLSALGIRVPEGRASVQ
jgi:hypothetical protein